MSSPRAGYRITVEPLSGATQPRATIPRRRVAMCTWGGRRACPLGAALPRSRACGGSQAKPEQGETLPPRHGPPAPDAAAHSTREPRRRAESGSWEATRGVWLALSLPGPANSGPQHVPSARWAGGISRPPRPISTAGRAAPAAPRRHGALASACVAKRQSDRRHLSGRFSSRAGTSLRSVRALAQR